MRKFKIGIAAALILAGAVVAANAQDKAAGAETKAAATGAKAAATTGNRSITGEVIDPACWVVNGAKGEAHKECAIACAKAGQILAILERKTNKVYLLVSERPGEDPNKGLTDFIAQAVVVKGKVYTRGGLLAVKVASVEPAPKTGSR
jgi:hypothetical protein